MRKTVFEDSTHGTATAEPHALGRDLNDRILDHAPVPNAITRGVLGRLEEGMSLSCMSEGWELCGQRTDCVFRKLPRAALLRQKPRHQKEVGCISPPLKPKGRCEFQNSISKNGVWWETNAA